MSAWIWTVVLVAAAWLTNWGADHLVGQFQKVRRRWGLTGVGGACLIGIFTGSPEYTTNSVSALRGVSDIGLGNMLGANIFSIPLVITVGWLAQRFGPVERTGDGRPLLHLEHATITVLTVPYLGIVALVGLLTLPAGWRGLQPIDGWIMLGAYLAFLVQGLLRGRGESHRERWTARGIAMALLGVGALGLGAYLIVRSTEQIANALGISHLVGGLFLAGLASIVPEALKTWKLVRAGQATAGATSVIPDNAVTMTLGFLPLALVGTAIEDFRLYCVNLAAAFLLAAVFAVVTYTGSRERGIDLREVLWLDGICVAWVGVVGWLIATGQIQQG